LIVSKKILMQITTTTKYHLMESASHLDVEGLFVILCRDLVEKYEVFSKKTILGEHGPTAQF
jgi:hypothetical protein